MAGEAGGVAGCGSPGAAVAAAAGGRLGPADLPRLRPGPGPALASEGPAGGEASQEEEEEGGGGAGSPQRPLLREPSAGRAAMSGAAAATHPPNLALSLALSGRADSVSLRLWASGGIF